MKRYSLGPTKACSGRIHWSRLNFRLIKLSELSNPWLFFFFLLWVTSVKGPSHQAGSKKKIIEKKRLVYIFLNLGQLSLTKKRNQLLLAMVPALEAVFIISSSAPGGENTRDRRLEELKWPIYSMSSKKWLRYEKQNIWRPDLRAKVKGFSFIRNGPKLLSWFKKQK